MTHPGHDQAAERHVAALIDGYRTTAIIYAAVELGLPDRFASVPASAETLARDLQLEPDFLYRLLRAMAALELCEELTDGSFVLTSAGRCLKSGTSSPLHDQTLIAVEQYFSAWAALAGSLRNGRPAFENVNGMAVWQARESNPRLGNTFSSWLTRETSRTARIIAQTLDLGGISRIADIGGGLGELTAEILTRNPEVTGVVFDQAAVIKAAESSLTLHDASDRMEFVAGDFFDAIPLRADMLILKSVLHDWNDREARAIIGNCRRAMGAAARLLIIERILPDRAKDDVETILLDVHMMAVTGGRERNLADFARLLGQEGLAIEHVERVAHFSLIDARSR